MQNASSSDGAELEVLQYANDIDVDKFSFHWTKNEGRRGRIRTGDEPCIITSPNFDQLYKCEVKEAGRTVVIIYKALYREQAKPCGQSCK